MFIKEAHDPSYISWHQDSTYWGLSHPDVVTAWIALSVSTWPTAACASMPGTHLKDQLPHKDTFAANNLLTRGQEVQVEVDQAEAVEHRAAARRVLAASRAHRARLRSQQRRLPSHRLRHPLCSDLSASRRSGRATARCLVRGVDNYHHFDTEPAPKADLDPEAVAQHKRITEAANAILYRGTDKAPKYRWLAHGSGYEANRKAQRRRGHADTGRPRLRSGGAKRSCAVLCASAPLR